MKPRRRSRKHRKITVVTETTPNTGNMAHKACDSCFSDYHTDYSMEPVESMLKNLPLEGLNELKRLVELEMIDRVSREEVAANVKTA